METSMKTVSPTIRNSFRSLWLLPAVAVLAMSTQVRAQDKPSLAECVSLRYNTMADAVNAATKATRNASGFRGMFVGVIDGSSTQPFYYGTTISGSPIGAKSLFEIGSVTKTFTATMLALLTMRGKVHVHGSVLSVSDTKLADVLTACTLPQKRKSITLADLADHHSGLPKKPPNTVSSLQDLWNDVCGPAAGDFSKSQFHYSNYGFAVLGQVMAPIYGSSNWPDSNTSAITSPLQMNDTKTWENLTQSQQQGLQAYPRNPSFPVVDPAGGLYSTPDDMMKWLSYNMSDAPHVCPTGDSACELRTLLPLIRLPREKGAGGVGSVGLGWQLNDLTKCASSPTVIWKGGDVSGFHAYIGYVPTAKRGVVVLTNVNGPDSHDLGKIGNQILSSIF